MYKTNMMKKIFFTLLSTLFILVIFASCSKLNEPVPLEPEVTTHKVGILDHDSPNFHGNLARENNWDLLLCQSCHSANYSGGITEASCLSCHTQPTGPEACNTCHGDFDDPNIIAPPEDTNDNVSTDSVGVGAHVHHLEHNELGSEIECSTCHKVPQNYFDPGHTDSPLPAEVILNNLAIHNIAVNANYDHPTATCSAVYCHGNFEFLKDSSSNQFAYTSDKMIGNNISIIWNQVDDSQAECGSCHNLPPVGHIAATLDACGGCHSGIVDSEGNIVDSLKYKHINGEKNVFGN
jgi:Geobacter CxxxxCH...CXXCH motif (GSu_C4xC__C2xCH)